MQKLIYLDKSDKDQGRCTHVLRSSNGGTTPGGSLKVESTYRSDKALAILARPSRARVAGRLPKSSLRIRSIATPPRLALDLIAV